MSYPRNPRLLAHSAPSADEKTFEVVPHPQRSVPTHAVALLRASKGPKAKSAPRPSGRAKKRGKQPKGWLSGTSLQDVADFTGAAWRFGKAALTYIGNIEEKVFDVTGAAVAATTGGVMANLTNIAQGNDYNQRNGNSIRINTVRLDISSFPGASTTYAFSRVVMFRDLMQSGTDPTAANLLEAATPNSPYLHYVADRFEIMYDEVFCYGITNGVGPGVFHRRIAAKVNDHCLYSGTTGADASNWQGALYLLVLSDQGTAANQPLFTYAVRTSFIDD